MKVKLSNVRLAFPALFEAKSVNGEGAPKYGACFIIEPNTTNVKSLDDAIVFVAKEKWKDKALQILSKLRADARVCFHKTPKTNSSGDIYDGFDGTYHVNSSNAARPIVLDRDKTPLTAADGKPYGGCYVNCTLDLWAQDNQYGKRVNATLTGVQFYRDGDAFAGGVPGSPDDFDDITEGADAEALA